MHDAMIGNIRQVLDQHAALSVDADELRGDDDLFNVGMKSFAVVNVVLALEDAFGITFPDDMLQPERFRSINQIIATIGQLP